MCPTLQADSLPSEPPGKPIDHGEGFYFNPNVRRCIEVLIWRTEVSYISYAFAVAVVLFCFFVLGFFFFWRGTFNLCQQLMLRVVHTLFYLTAYESYE